ncbi:family 16 glycosylhydrolase [Sphingomonas sp. BIUV-7]|uniref:Family 16 glycosylhydrolase n=1 Tax=Sphingomonas natans TaxID=3063330 RepID=A0ABT8YCL0_9SPHN|nr:family 16 glycosylhydrolase [Sphingomonas sp. BIUV-7]MDO6416079.1 family 16 glycosylhydrolase [Sphingomonas sp. BIUV-7]
MPTPSVTWTEQFAGTALDLDGYAISFDDEFDDLSITTGVTQGAWFSGVHSDFGSASFARGPNALDPFSVSDGVLTIRMLQKDGVWQSGLLQSVDSSSQGFKQAYGYFEMKAKFPDGAGAWPAFWLISDESTTDPTAARVEIDTVEAYSGDPTGLHTTIHYTPGKSTSDLPSKTAGGNYERVSASMFDGRFHTYGTMITPQWITTYFDGKEVARVAASDYSKTPFYMILNLAMSEEGSKDPHAVYDMNVDYVRVYSNPTVTTQAAYGTSGNDDLTGTAGKDIMDGQQGADRMAGGSGDDIYYVDNVGDKVVEAVASGTDYVFSSVNYTLPNEVENLTLIGGANITGRGNDYSNLVTGNDGDNYLLGLGGSDTLIGGKGNDILDGGIGADMMNGGLGDDIYFVDNVNDLITESANQGWDIVRASVDFRQAGQSLERIQLEGSANISAYGDSQNNVLIGNAANNVLDGGVGADTMTGGKGDDTYYVDNLADKAIEKIGEGNDILYSTIGYSLQGTNIEALFLVGDANIVASGSDGNDRLYGNDGNNILYGQAGSDFMAGGKGNDTYYVDNVGDRVIENTGEGNDTVYATIGFSASGQSIETIVLLSGKAIGAIGSASDNSIYGNDMTNSLDGGDGNDVLYGRLGNDILIGGSGDDIFVFDTAVSYTNIDNILDFNSGQDKIHLSQRAFAGMAGPGVLNSKYFQVGTKAATADSHVLYDPIKGNLLYDPDGSGPLGTTPFAHVEPGTLIFASDFLMI